MARLAPSLVHCRDEVNARWPGRDTGSDGWIGDPAHQARTSDHNPDPITGLVHALDVDEDLSGRNIEDGSELFTWLDVLRRVHDPRIKYVIYEGRMFSSYAAKGYPAWAWRPYDGVNLHTRHCHISILYTGAAENDLRTWFSSYAPAPSPSPIPTPQPEGWCTVNLRVLRNGSKGGDVRSLQALLNAKTGTRLSVDGDFGPATTSAVRNVQRFFRLAQDGVVGARTWGALFL